MAKVVYTAIVAELSGRLSGSVFQRSVGGYQLRSLGIPRNPQTWLQQKNRVTLEYLASHWRTLTDTEQNSYSGGTNQERFNNYVAFNFRYAWQTGSLVETEVTKTPHTMPDWYAADAGYSSGSLYLNLYNTLPGSFSFDEGEGSYRIRDFTPPGTPVNGQWRVYRMVGEFYAEDFYAQLNLTENVFPAITTPTVHWLSEIQILYETATAIGQSNIIGFQRAS